MHARELDLKNEAVSGRSSIIIPIAVSGRATCRQEVALQQCAPSSVDRCGVGVVGVRIQID